MTAGKRRIILLGLALGMAGFAAFMVKTYLDRKATELEAKYQDRTEKVSVVVARVNVPAKTRVTLDDFAIRRIPADMVPPDAINPADIERALGQSMKVNLPLGRPLLWGYLSSGTNPTFSDMLEEDRRALTIAVDELNSISGMIRPYDRIDLFIISTERSFAPGKRNNKMIMQESKVVMPLMQDVLVKATGNIVRRETTADGREFDRRYSTLTLDLLPDEIGKVLIAQENGELKAALKRPEQNVANYLPTRESDLWGRKDENLRVDEHLDFITFYIGGSGGNGAIKTELQPYTHDVIAGSRVPASDDQTGILEDVGEIGGPMSRQQIELLEQHMKQHREAEATATSQPATDSAISQSINTAAAEPRRQ